MNVVPQIDVAAKVDDDLWYKDAVIYQLHVKAFADSNGDGIGDFTGLMERLDYLQDLGVTCLWLLPFYPSPGRDDGYDIADYGDVNPAFGTLKDFRRFMQEAKRRGLRVITELVVNHTSDQHDWFKRARRSAPGSSARNWYVWSDTDQKYLGTRIIFTDTEKSNWAWDPEAGAYYWHRFFSHQPDLNFENPRVVSAVIQVMKRWLDTGVDGFRLDAVPYLIEREGTSNENLPETHAIIRKLRAELDAYAPGKVLLAEANMWPEDVQQYFGNGDECQMAYHFPLMPRIFMAIAQEDRFPIADIMRQTPEIPENCQWAMFLRNHDELTLEMVTDVERDYLWSTYAADPRARINLGIRRRLAPLMDNDRRKIELMNSLLLSMPGTPIIYYGDEIGMGDNIYLGDRNGVRTPMQWTPDRNAGFSRCDPARLYAPVIMDPVYGYTAVNVEAQANNISSLLSWMKRLISVRRSSKCFGRGTLSFIRPANRAVLAYVRQYENETILCVANLSRSAQSAELDLSPWKGHIPQEMLGRSRFPRIGELPYLLTFAPYGFFWFTLCDEPDQRTEVKLVPHEFTTLVVGEDMSALASGRSHRTLERDVLPGFLHDRRWFGDKGSRPPVTRMETAIPLAGDGVQALLGLVSVTAEGGEQVRYLLPLVIRWTRLDRTQPLTAQAIAAVRRGPREGTLIDAAGDLDLNRLLLTNIQAERTVTAGERRIEFRRTPALETLPSPPIEKLKTNEGEQSNTTSVADANFVIKWLRKVNEGLHPEIEMGRFLVEAGFKNAPELVGWAQLVEGEAISALAVVHRFVENQGDAWTVTAHYLDRFIDEQRILTTQAEESAELAAYLQRTRTLGRRTAEMQRALASRSDVPDFAPEPITPQDVAAWTQRLLDRTERTFDQLEKRRSELPERSRALAERLLNERQRIADHVAQLLPSDTGGSKIRHHGDYHLGQVLIAKDDAFILDFEGEPRRSLAERRQKAPAARDVAGMIRSIDYSTTAVLMRANSLTPDECAALTPKLRVWRDQATQAFWEACREGEAAALWPADPEAAQRLLDFFLMEKALYEVEYELTNRPAWINVPLEGVWGILIRNGVVQP